MYNMNLLKPTLYVKKSSFLPSSLPSFLSPHVGGGNIRPLCFPWWNYLTTFKVHRNMKLSMKFCPKITSELQINIDTKTNQIKSIIDLFERKPWWDRFPCKYVSYLLAIVVSGDNYSTLTIFNNVDPRNIIVGCWKFNMNMSLFV